MRSISHKIELSASILVSLVVVCAAAQGQTVPPVGTLDDNGWTTFTRGTGARSIYVSSSIGRDTNSGLSPSSPLASIAKGLTRLRNGSDDQLLLKAGDIWHSSINWPGVSGASAAHPILVSSYGPGSRPLIDSGAQEGFHAVNGSISNLAIIGLEFYASSRDPNSSTFSSAASKSTPSGMNWTINASNILIEDCKIGFYALDIVFAGENIGMFQNNIAIRRNVIVDAYSTATHSQGLYVEGTTNLVVEGNLFDHNGWNMSIPGAEATIYNRNVYLNDTNGPVTFIGNISANSASEGAQFRSGGSISDNLFVANSNGFDLGHLQESPTITRGFVSKNVVLKSKDIEASPVPLPRANGIIVYRASGARIQITNNIIAHAAGALVNQSGIKLDYSVGGIIAVDNIVYDWANPFIDLGYANKASSNAIDQAANYSDPNRTVETYNASLGGAASLGAFLALARLQSKSNWDARYTAGAVNNYIRSGFGAR